MPDAAQTPIAVIVMGVSGCGKTSVGDMLAKRLGAVFIEGDSLHPQANIDKMAVGIPLNDDDRWPWLDVIGMRMAEQLQQGRSVVASCSALRHVYRERLRTGAGARLRFVFLNGSHALLSQRMGERQGHFMPTALLESQLATLEPPTGEAGVVTVSIDQEVSAIVAEAEAGLRADQI
ncbi:gluconokinase [Rhizobium halophytocola]|nr:gluconokinase [Rhizobium halophytocola]